MTVQTSASQTTAIGNGVTSVFSFSFPPVAASDIEVIYTDLNGLQTLVNPASYTLFINPVTTGQLWSTSGTITYLLNGSPIAVGASLLIRRKVPFTQQTTIRNQGPFYETVVEQALDTLCYEIQQVAARTGQLRGTWVTGVLYNFGDIVQDGVNGANTQNYYTCVITNTSTTWATDLAAGDWSLALNIQQTAQYATNAAASATAAAGSATSASTSAANSASSATASGISAAASSASAVSAAASSSSAASQASNAATSATSASTSATNAATSATSASTSANNAATSATTATTQAGIATTQATAAAGSATAAATSATAAAASATQAAGSLLGTSSTSTAVALGSKTFTTQAGLSLGVGGFVTVADTVTPANYMHGQVTSYSGTTLVINVLDDGGSGTHASWSITTSSPQGPTGSGAGTVNSGTALQMTYYAGTGTAVSGNANATISSGALTLGQAASIQGSLILSGSAGSATTLAAPTTGTGTMTLQAGTDTLVARATTDTFTNKTLTSSANVLGGVTMTLGSDATGDIYYRAAGGALTRLANGGVNKVLHGSGSVPSYSAVVEGDLGLTDITTANVTSTAHGFAPKSPANAGQFLNGAATPAYASVTDANLSVSDVTTNNVTSTTHGFAPKSPANAAQFLNGAATPAYASVTDANLSVSDVTTNNVSTTAHGFAPKAPNDATQFLDGTGAYSKPVSSGDWVLLVTATASASASLDFLSLISSTYSNYVFLIDSIVCAGAGLRMRVSIDNSTFISANSSYTWTNDDETSDVATPTSTLTGSSSAATRAYLQIASSGNNGDTYNGQVWLYNPAAAVAKRLSWVCPHTGSGATSICTTGFGSPNTTSAILGAQFISTTSTLTSGKISMYGIKA